MESTVATQLSLWTLFIQADIVVKVVMVMLLLASFWCWAIIFDKLMKLRHLVNQAEDFEDSFWSGGSLEDLYDRVGNRPVDPMSAVFAAAMRERRRSAAKGLANPPAARAHLPQRIGRLMSVPGGRPLRRLAK